MNFNISSKGMHSHLIFKVCIKFTVIWKKKNKDIIMVEMYNL